MLFLHQGFNLLSSKPLTLHFVQGQYFLNQICLCLFFLSLITASPLFSSLHPSHAAIQMNVLNCSEVLFLYLVPEKRTIAELHPPGCSHVCMLKLLLPIAMVISGRAFLIVPLPFLYRVWCIHSRRGDVLKN